MWIVIDCIKLIEEDVEEHSRLEISTSSWCIILSGYLMTTLIE